MSTFNVEFINPFLSAATRVLGDVCQIETTIGAPSLKEIVQKEDSLIIIIGVTGEIKGSVMIDLTIDEACEIASKMMMGMPVNELNEMAQSAISELANMILGNAATIFSSKGITIDITPPSLCIGTMSISINNVKNVCIPLLFEDKKIEINISLKQE